MPVRPQVDVALVLQRPLRPVVVLLFPARFETRDRGGRQSGSVRSQQRRERFAEIPRADSLQIQPGQQILEGLRFAKVGWENRRTEALPLALPTPVPNPGLLDRHLSHRCLERSFGQVAVANDLAMAGIVYQNLAGRDVSNDLRLDGLTKHLPGAFSKDSIENVFCRFLWKRNQIVGSFLQGGVPPCPFRANWVLQHTQGTPPVQIFIHNFWLYLLIAGYIPLLNYRAISRPTLELDNNGTLTRFHGPEFPLQQSSEFNVMG